MDPTIPGMPLNIVPPPMQAAMAAPPTGILNGQQAPQQAGNGQLMNQAMALMKGNQQPMPQMPQIQMARPVGTQGIDPMKLLAAMKQNQLLNA